MPGTKTSLLAPCWSLRRALASTARGKARVSAEMASPNTIDRTTGPSVTGVGAGVAAGEFAFDVPDDQTCLRASLEGERMRRNGVAPETAPAEPPRDDSESHFPPLGPDDSDDSDELTENITDDDWDSASSQSVSDDEELDEPVADTQLEEVQPTLRDAPNQATTNVDAAEPGGASRDAVSASDRLSPELLAQLPAQVREALEAEWARTIELVRTQERSRAPRRVDARDGDGEDPPRRRQRRRRNPAPGQSTLNRYWHTRGENEAASPDAAPSTSRRRRSEPAAPEPSDIPVPRNPPELYEKWYQLAYSIIPENASVYSKFMYAFGDETDAGCAYRRVEMEAVGKLLLQFKADRGRPGQHAILKGREREGKTGALFSIALAALLLRMRVVILCAPNKVAPVVDMVKKLQQSGFNRHYSVKHTLGKKATEENGIPSAESGQIFVAALCTISDLRRVKRYIEDERRGGNFTVTLVDECDEITQGKGNKSLDVERGEDPDAYQEFIHPDRRGEDEAGVRYVRPGSRASRQLSRKQQLAFASQYFKQNIHDTTQIIACSATLSGYILNPIGTFKNDVVTSIFMVFPKLGYRGIETFKIPEGCELDTEGNLTPDDLRRSESVAVLLKRFYERKNACDGERLLQRSSPAPGPEPGPSGTSEAGSVTLRGILFISCSPKVNVYGGYRDIAKAVCDIVTSWPVEECRHDPNTTLFVCFVGKPWVYFNGKWEKMTAGKSVEDMYNKTEEKARNGHFGVLGLGANDPLSKVCKHVVLIGYNMTRRAMTAAFRPASEPRVLCKVQYGILTTPKAVTIDTVSQRVNRPSHDFAEHVVPANYCVDVAMSSWMLRLCQQYRKLEDEMVDRQRADPKPHCEFRQRIEVFASELDKAKVSKRGILMSELSRTGQEQRRREQLALELDQLPVLVEFKAWLEKQPVRPGREDTLAASTVQNYYNHVRRLFVNDATVEDVLVRARATITQPRSKDVSSSEYMNELSAMRYFESFRSELDRSAE